MQYFDRSRKLSYILFVIFAVSLLAAIFFFFGNAAVVSMVSLIVSILSFVLAYALRCVCKDAKEELDSIVSSLEEKFVRKK